MAWQDAKVADSREETSEERDEARAERAIELDRDAIKPGAGVGPHGRERVLHLLRAHSSTPESGASRLGKALGDGGKDRGEGGRVKRRITGNVSPVVSNHLGLFGRIADKLVVQAAQWGNDRASGSMDTSGKGGLGHSLEEM